MERGERERKGETEMYETGRERQKQVREEERERKRGGREHGKRVRIEKEEEFVLSGLHMASK